MVEETKEQEIPEVKAEEQGSTTLIDGANEAAERMEKANAKREEILKKEEELEARKRLGGRAAGADQEQGKKEESDEDYANRALRGEIPEA